VDPAVTPRKVVEILVSCCVATGPRANDGTLAPKDRVPTHREFRDDFGKPVDDEMIRRMKHGVRWRILPEYVIRPWLMGLRRVLFRNPVRVRRKTARSGLTSWDGGTAGVAAIPQKPSVITDNLSAMETLLFDVMAAGTGNVRCLHQRLRNESREARRECPAIAPAQAAG
jgi:hypothetical protein